MLKSQRNLLIFLAKFLGLFGLLFYGTEGIIGLSTPEGQYSAFVAAHLDYITPFRHFLLMATKGLLAQFDFPTYLKDQYTLRMVGGRGIFMAYDCIGYGIISFWIAFVFANNGSWKRKAAWMIGGTVLLCILNIIRVGLLVVAFNKDWPIPLGWDHHTWFNIVAYACIFAMIYGYDRSAKRGNTKADVQLHFVQQKPGGGIVKQLSPTDTV